MVVVTDDPFVERHETGVVVSEEWSSNRHNVENVGSWDRIDRVDPKDNIERKGTTRSRLSRLGGL